MSQKAHIRDWRLAGSVCKRIRRLSKEAFFSSKIFVMEMCDAKSLQETKLPRLSIDDRETASKYIRRINLAMRDLSRDFFIALPRCITGFPHLQCLDFFFGGEHGEPLSWMDQSPENREQAPLYLIRLLKSLHIPVEKLNIGILKDPAFNWTL